MLERELDYFNKNLDELLKHYEGQFALIKDDKLVGCFTTEAEAYEQGLQLIGNEPFLIKQVTKTEKVDRLPALVLGLIDASL